MTPQVYTLPEYMAKRFGGARLRVYLSCLSLVLYIFTKLAVSPHTGGRFNLQLAQIGNNLGQTRENMSRLLPICPNWSPNLTSLSEDVISTVHQALCDVTWAGESVSEAL